MQRTFILSRKYLSNYSNLSKECWQSILLTLIESSATGICFFLSIYFVSILHISIAEAGILISSYGAGTICGSLISGKLSDSLSSKKISTISLSIQSIAFFLLAHVENKNILLINMFIIGFCTYGFMTSNNVWMLRQCHNNTEMRFKSINITRAASNLGMGISGIIIGCLSVERFPTLFYLSSLLLVFSACYFHYLVKDNFEKPGTNYHTSLSEEQTKKHKKIIFLMLNCLFLIGLIISQLNITYPVYIQQSFPKMGTSAVSILFILDTLMIVFLQTPLVNSLKNYNKILLVGIGAILMGFGMFILNFCTFFYGAIISCLIWTTGEMIFIGMAQFVCYESGAETKKGQTMGIFQTTSAAGRIAGPSIGGYIYYCSGGHTLWTLSLIIGIYCFLMCVYFMKYDFIKY